MGKFSTLEKCSLTSSWSLEERTALAHFLTERRVAAGDVVFNARSENRLLIIIGQGVIRVSYENLSKDFQDGDSIAELSLLHDTHKLVSAVATKETTLWILDLDSWTQLRRVAPVISLKLMEAISQKLATLLNNSVPPPKVLSGRAS